MIIRVPILSVNRCSVHSLTKCRDMEASERVAGIHQLDEKISKWWQQVTPDFKLTPSKVAEIGNKTQFFSQVLLLNAVYYQSLGALHASIVPLFSWSAPDNSWLVARQCSAQVAFEQACSFSELIKAVISNNIRPSSIPSFVAYAAYVGCAILMPFMWCSNSIVQSRVHANVKADIEMIKTVAVYWKFAALLVWMSLFYFRSKIMLNVVFLANARRLLIRNSPTASDRTRG